MIITDLDGTIALIEHRRHLVEKKMAFQQWFDSLSVSAQQHYERMLPPEGIMESFLSVTKWKPDWGQFYDLCDKDDPNIPVIELLSTMASYHEIFVFSGRSQVVREKTVEWLHKYDVPCTELVMRAEKDYTPDEVLKLQWLEKYFPGDKKREILFILDDRQKVVDMWRRIGLTCFQVAPGNF